MFSYLKEKNIVIPMYLYRMREKLSLSLEEFFFLMYLYHFGERLLFDAPHIAQDFGCDIRKVMDYVSLLQEKKLIKIDVLKNEKNIIEEYISLEPFFDKLTILFKEEVNEKNEKGSKDYEDIFQLLEECFGRSLSSIDREFVKAWFERHYTEEIIKEAIKEAMYNGVGNLKYIDHILYEWNKKGFTCREDIENNKKENHKPKEKVDVCDDDWLDDDEW